MLVPDVMTGGFVVGQVGNAVVPGFVDGGASRPGSAGAVVVRCAIGPGRSKARRALSDSGDHGGRVMRQRWEQRREANATARGRERQRLAGGAVPCRMKDYWEAWHSGVV